MKGINFKTILVIFAAIMLMVGCGNKNDTAVQVSGDKKSQEDTSKLKIVTTFYPMYEFTKNIAGDKASVELLIPSTIEPHEWEPTPKDIANIQSSDVFVYNSPYMETWVQSIQKSNDNDKLEFVEASKGISLVEGVEEEEHGHEEEHEHGHEMDPHVWLSPALAKQEVQNITSALVKADPSNKDSYEDNSKKYMEKLTQLDQEYRTELQNVKKKEIITQHAAFSYLASEYGLQQVPIAGLSPEQEPSAKKLAELKKFAKEHDVKVIYFEELASPAVAKTLANEIGAKTEVLNTLEGLSDEDQENGLDYIKVMEKNLEKLIKNQS
ncbi:MULTISPECIES: metal ABC transporter substrate-binding protein [Heyndrickxia]|uniref:metal ABC transporter substrate-binding protein n=1 Tax=Heyndrickxia TaxID=2837504 RepID=UPI000D3A00A6|nr:metal ABC transporter substrate-binding protein [Heyndrickxia sporothermodurans]MED3652250.1 metal ABC transporter substrate-binding protein [Heyndrickxia sporothermodurans]MED3696831.1 metal ABC transporter substrate-binding protein [Heyndrickxia sporothermodurans]PTY76565.1 zinc ABC transporter substrate-binding protein [Heyndrickxia sporothermodurans]